ncbi:hypothetical protein [Cytobacillus oceanisediminis]|uniref:hypothetical protein n=1 Tax=Cytobacillus oceanisediminis TaxID=665099 RepID=UPI0011A55CDC
MNLRDGVKGRMCFENGNGKKYELKEKRGVLMVGGRGWEVEEKDVLVDGKGICGGLLDLGMYFLDNGKMVVK